jgi:hypothetical protein
MVFYLMAFAPLLRITGLSSQDITDQTRKIEVLHEIGVMQFLHNVFFAMASITYLLVLQIRLKVWRVGKTGGSGWKDWIIMPLGNAIFNTISLLIWLVCCLGGLVIAPILGRPPIIALGAIFGIYAVLADICVLLVNWTELNFMPFRTGEESRHQQNKFKFTLAVSLLTVLGLSIFPLLSGTIYSNDPDNRRLFYRLGFTLSPLWYTCGIIFVNLVSKLMKADSGTSKQMMKSKIRNPSFISPVITTDINYAIQRVKI